MSKKKKSIKNSELVELENAHPNLSLELPEKEVQQTTSAKKKKKDKLKETIDQKTRKRNGNAVDEFVLLEPAKNKQLQLDARERDFKIVFKQVYEGGDFKLLEEAIPDFEKLIDEVSLPQIKHLIGDEKSFNLVQKYYTQLGIAWSLSNNPENRKKSKDYLQKAMANNHLPAAIVHWENAKLWGEELVQPALDLITIANKNKTFLDDEIQLKTILSVTQFLRDKEKDSIDDELKATIKEKINPFFPAFNLKDYQKLIQEKFNYEPFTFFWCKQIFISIENKNIIAVNKEALECYFTQLFICLNNRKDYQGIYDLFKKHYSLATGKVFYLFAIFMLNAKDTLDQEKINYVVTWAKIAIQYLDKKTQKTEEDTIALGGLYHVLGRVYDDVKCINTDYVEAKKFYELAIKISEHPEAKHDLAEMYRMGKGVDVDIAKSASLYGEAFKEGVLNSGIQWVVQSYAKDKNLAEAITRAESVDKVYAENNQHTKSNLRGELAYIIFVIMITHHGEKKNYSLDNPLYDVKINLNKLDEFKGKIEEKISVILECNSDVEFKITSLVTLAVLNIKNNLDKAEIYLLQAKDFCIGRSGEVFYEILKQIYKLLFHIYYEKSLSEENLAKKRKFELKAIHFAKEAEIDIADIVKVAPRDLNNEQENLDKPNIVRDIINGVFSAISGDKKKGVDNLTKILSDSEIFYPENSNNLPKKIDEISKLIYSLGDTFKSCVTLYPDLIKLIKIFLDNKNQYKPHQFFNVFCAIKEWHLHPVNELFAKHLSSIVLLEGSLYQLITKLLAISEVGFTADNLQTYFSTMPTLINHCQELIKKEQTNMVFSDCVRLLRVFVLLDVSTTYFRSEEFYSLIAMLFDIANQKNNNDPYFEIFSLYQSYTYFCAFVNIKINPQIEKEAEKCAQKNTSTISNTQQEIYGYLGAKDKTVEHEKYLSDIKRTVDYFKEKKLIIEFDGPVHYISKEDGDIFSPTPQTMLRNATFELYGYKIVIISYLDWAKKQTNEEREAFAEMILLQNPSSPKVTRFKLFDKKVDINVSEILVPKIGLGK